MITEQIGFAHLSDLPCWQLRFGDACAVISSYGAQVLSYQPKPEQEVLWLSPLSSWHQQQAIRGGIPICWPWFGPADANILPDATTLPNHGLVRNRLWQLHHKAELESATQLTLKVTLDTLPHVASPVTLYLQLTLSNTLTIELRCDAPITQQAALHSYFAIAPLIASTVGSETIQQIQIQGLSQSYVDKVSGQPTQQANDHAHIDSETDRVYRQPAAEMKLIGDKHPLTLNQAGQDHAVLWNPWQQKSQAMPDMPDDGYQHFICLETARLHWQPMPLLLKQQIRL